MLYLSLNTLAELELERGTARPRPKPRSARSTPPRWSTARANARWRWRFLCVIARESGDIHAASRLLATLEPLAADSTTISARARRYVSRVLNRSS